MDTIIDVNEISLETVKSLRGKLDRREIGARELCAAYIEQINELNPDLNALISIFTEEALATADEAQKLIDDGRAETLTGIPCALSDNIMTAGKVTSCASKMLENFIPPYDAAVTETLINAHSPLLGKTDLNEFSVGGTFKSGTAVCSGFVPFSLGSDTGGALRLAAAYNELTGLRPTYGRVSRYGMAAHASSLDQIGPLAKTAEDCAIVLNSIAKKDPRDLATFESNEDFTEKIGESIKGLKIALPKQFFDTDNGNISDEVKTAVMLAAKELEKQGAVLKEISTEMANYAAPVYFIIAGAEASSNFSRYDGITFGLRGEGKTFFEQITDSRNRGFGDRIKRRILLGNFVLSSENYKDYYEKALALRQKIKAEYNEIFKEADVVLTPTLPKINPHKYLLSFCTAPPALAGLPSITTTCGCTPLGIPMGMLLTGNRFNEKTIIQVADRYENLTR